MSQFYQYNWPAPLNNGVALQQTITFVPPNTAVVSLNGGYSTPGYSGINFLGFGFSRGIVIVIESISTSVVFTIMGVQNGTPLTEQITIPANSTSVTSVNYYDIVIGVGFTLTQPSTTIPSLTVTIGTTTFGALPLILLNSLLASQTILAYALQVICTTGDTIGVYLALSNISGNNITCEGNMTNGLATLLTTISSSGITQYTDAAQVLMIAMPAIAETATVQFFQR